MYKISNAYPVFIGKKLAYHIFLQSLSNIVRTEAQHSQKQQQQKHTTMTSYKQWSTLNQRKLGCNIIGNQSQLVKIPEDFSIQGSVVVSTKVDGN